MNAFASFLRQQLDQSLPGLHAQRKMEPHSADGGANPRRQPPSTAITSGVMVLVFPHKSRDYEIVLTVRSEDIEQGGQICLPGGRSEENESPEETALRETWEEIGVSSDLINILGKLTPLYVNTSNSIIHPLVGYTPQKPSFKRDPVEVQEVFTTPLAKLISDHHLENTRWNLKGRSYHVPHWTIHSDVPLWGATAMILSEFLELYRLYKSEE